MLSRFRGDDSRIAIPPRPGKLGGTRRPCLICPAPAGRRCYTSGPPAARRPPTEVAMPGRTIRTFTVLPSLPERLQPLHKLAYNLWWCWNPDAVALFRRIDSDLFEALDNSPVRLLGAIPQDRIGELAAADSFLAHLDPVAEALDRYLPAPTWF